MIYAGVNGYLDELAVDKVGEFEQGLLTHLRSEGQAVLDSIRDEQKITDETEDKLKANIDAFAKSFS